MSCVIIVSLRIAASAVAPSAPMSLRQRLRVRGKMGNSKRIGVSMGADMEAPTQAAAHLSSLSTLFSLMKLAMMMAEVTPSRFPERSNRSVGFVPLSSSI